MHARIKPYGHKAERIETAITIAANTLFVLMFFAAVFLFAYAFVG